MKRALLIAGGTIGGLGAVLAITPPQLANTTVFAADTPAPVPSVTPSATGTSSPSATGTANPTKAPAVTAKSFTGDVYTNRYGPVQVKITIDNGVITNAQAVQAPSGSNAYYTNCSLPKLRQQTLQAQSANIQGASCASFTSYSWYQSLVSAIAKAGL